MLGHNAPYTSNWELGEAPGQAGQPFPWCSFRILLKPENSGSWFLFQALFRNVAHILSVLIFTNISGEMYYPPRQENIM